MKSLVLRTLVVAVAVLFGSSNCLHAQTSGTQSFTVVVPTSISITAPTNAVSITHNELDTPQAFPAQTWSVKGNAKNGVNVTFSVASPFVKSDDNTIKRNAKLELAVAGTPQGPATWTVDVPSDTTNYGSNDNEATVRCSSNGAGRASLNLSVSFETETYGLFPAGDYVTTVTGTIAAK